MFESVEKDGFGTALIPILIVAMLIVVPIIGMWSFGVGLADPSVIPFLQSRHYTDVHITGYSWTGCGQTQNGTGFTAISPVTGEEVDGVVCSQIGNNTKFIEEQ